MNNMISIYNQCRLVSVNDRVAYVILASTCLSYSCTVDWAYFIAGKSIFYKIYSHFLCVFHSTTLETTARHSQDVSVLITAVYCQGQALSHKPALFCMSCNECQ